MFIHTCIAYISYTFHNILIVLLEVYSCYNTLIRGLHEQQNKLEEVSVINFVVKDLKNKRNIIGQNGLKSLDKMAFSGDVENCACREFNTCKGRK